MSCPTCDHTMSEWGCRVGDAPFWWCPRCGTYKTCDGQVAAPALVERCRQFEPAIHPPNLVPPRYREEWARRGIAEAINLPDRRPK